MARRIVAMSIGLMLFFAALLSLSPRNAASAPVSDPRPLMPNPICMYPNPNYTPAQHWTLNAPMPTPRFSFALIAPGGLSQVYAIGGLQGWTDALTTNERFNACTNTWETLAPLPAPRGYIQAAELNGNIYIVGGVDHVVSGTFGVQRSVWVYHPAINYWSQASDLPIALGGVAVATANGKLYVFGGFDARGPGAGDVNTVYEYDLGRDRWNLRSTLPDSARSLAAAAQFNGEIYVAGNSIHTDVYNPASRTWRTAQVMPDGHYGFSLVAAPDGFLYALGGSHSNNDSWFALQRYDPGADAWDYISTPEVNDYLNHGLSSGVYAAGRLFLMGGIGQIYDTVVSNVNESMHLLESLCESSLQAAPDSVAPGERITYTIGLRGEVNPLPNVILLDPIPDGTTFDGFVGNPSGASYNAIDDQVEWHNPLPASPAPITITFSVRVNTTGWMNARLITNTLFIHNGLNVITRSTGTWLDAFDLSPSFKQVDAAEITAGYRLTYHLRVATTSPAGGSASLSDPVPFAVDYIADTLTATHGTTAYANGVITWSGELTPHLQAYTNTSGDYQWGDSLGNGAVPGVKYDWIEIAQTGQPYGFFSPDNDRCYHAAFPFDFHFYDLHRTTASISTNGTMYFPNTNGYTNYRMGWENLPIPSDYNYEGYAINRFIAPLWDDLYILPGWIYYQQFGTAPNRTVVIEFANVSRHADEAHPGETGSFEMIFYEGSSAIQFQYKDVNFDNPLYDKGASATVGVQGSATSGIQYSYNSPSLSDRLAILFVPPDQTITYTGDYVDISYIVALGRLYPDRTPIVNTATITSAFGQVITREAVSLYRVPDLSASYKTVDRPIARPGEEVTYTIYADNTAVVPGIGEITDQLPAGTTYVSGSLTSPEGYGHYADGLVYWRLLVPPHSRIPISFRATINGDVSHRQVITNTAVITMADYNIVHDSSAPVRVDKPADLFVEISAPGTIQPLQTLTYTIAYGNRGPFGADDPATISDVLSPDLVYVDSSPSGFYSPTARTVTWGAGALASGVTHTLTVTVLVPGDFMPSAVMTNAVSVTAIPQDANSANNSQPWFTRVGDGPNLLNDTAKTIDPAVASLGDVVTYTILIRNTGNLATTATITDPLPSGVSYEIGSSTVDDVPSELYNSGLNQIEWTGLIGIESERVIRFRALFTTTSVLTNTVTIDDGAGIRFERAVANVLPQRFIFLPVIRR